MGNWDAVHTNRSVGWNARTYAVFANRVTWAVFGDVQKRCVTTWKVFT